MMTTYVLAVCYDDPEHIIQTLQRDGFRGNSDEFVFLIDPVGNRANGYGFGVNAMGAQTEVILSADDADASWDNKWYSAVMRHPDKWVVEMKIPLKSIRFKEDITAWRFNWAGWTPAAIRSVYGHPYRDSLTLET